MTLKEKARNEVASDVYASVCAHVHTHSGHDAIYSTYRYVWVRTYTSDNAFQETVQQVLSLSCVFKGTPISILTYT